MDSVTISSFIGPHQKKGVFKGVFPCDQLPHTFQLPAAFVINLSPHNEPGSHWVAVYIAKNGHAYYFDSFGFGIRNYFIKVFLKNYSSKLTFNCKQLQHISSNKCGKFCCVFVAFILKNCSISDFLKKFSMNLFVNDIIIDNMYNYLDKL